MEDGFKNKFGFIIFVLFVLALGIGGFFYTKYTIKELNKEEEKEKAQIVDYKIDPQKDFIYYENESTISEEGEIYYKDVVINLKTQTVLNENLNKENQNYKNNIRYQKDVDTLTNEIINYNYDGIYSVKFREYNNYEYNNYVSLVLKDYNFSCFDDVTFDKTEAYVFNTENGEVVKEDELLKLYKLSMEDVKEKMRTYLEEKQSVVDGNSVIKIDETLNALDNYSFYINNFGHLYITYLVKTTQVDYNEDMEVI